MSIRFVFAAGVIAAALLSPSSNAQVITHRDVGVRMGLRDRRRPRSTSASRTATASAVAVVDRGRPAAACSCSRDKANPHNIELRAAQGLYGADLRPDHGRVGQAHDRDAGTSPRSGSSPTCIALRGGVPIKIGNETIGAVGVSGASSGGRREMRHGGHRQGRPISSDDPAAHPGGRRSRSRSRPRRSRTAPGRPDPNRGWTARYRAPCRARRRRPGRARRIRAR